MISIRNAGRDDLPSLVAWNAAMAEETEARALDRARLGRGVARLFDEPHRGFYLIAELDGVAVGCVLATHEWSDWRDGDFWWLQSVYVTPDARRGGVFRTLFAEVEKRARAAAAVGLRLYVERDNQRAQQAYRKNGMREAVYLMYEAPFD